MVFTLAVVNHHVLKIFDRHKKYIKHKLVKGLSKNGFDRTTERQLVQFPE